MRFLPLVVLLSSAAAAAATPLDPYDAQSFAVGMPRGWRITSDASRGIVVAEEDPGRKDAAALVLMTSSNSIQSADALLDAVAAHVAGDLRVLRREAISGGGSLMVADGRAGDVPVRLGVIGIVQGTTSIVCLAVARPRRFDELGGIDFVVAVLSSIQSKAPAAQPAPPSNDPNYIPPPTRPLTVSDVAGDWKMGDSTSITNYVNSGTGAYAGFQAISIRDHWVIAPDGRFKGDFMGVRTGIGGPSAVSQHYVGAIISPLRYAGPPRQFGVRVMKLF